MHDSGGEHIVAAASGHHGDEHNEDKSHNNQADTGSYVSNGNGRETSCRGASVEGQEDDGQEDYVAGQAGEVEEGRLEGADLSHKSGRFSHEELSLSQELHHKLGRRFCAKCI